MERRKHEIPTLIIISGVTHEALTYSGVQDIEQNGAQAVDHWMELNRLSIALESKFGKEREEAVEESTKPSSASSIVQNNKTSNHHPSLCEVISSWASVRSTSPPSDVCCICLEGYSVGDTICVAKKPTCDHLFHKDCVLEWMKTNDECPLCRINLLQ